MSYVERMSAPALLTAEELLRLNLPNKRTELVRGRLVVREPAGYVHGDVAMLIGAAVLQHVEANSLGRVFAARVYRADGSETQMDDEGSLEGEELLPGFRLSLKAVLR